MDIYFQICRGLSIGVLVGFFLGGFKKVVNNTPFTEQKIQTTKKIVEKISRGLKYITFLLLILGFIWCCYFLILGIMAPEQADYANNMAELIVSVLTVISILFAFVEFLRRTDDKK